MRAERAMKDYLLVETSRVRVRERKQIVEVRSMLSVLQARVASRGITTRALEMRQEYTKRLYELEHPETKGDASLRSQVASAELSDMSTRRFHRNYRAAARSQWINEIRTAEWEDGAEPTFTGRTSESKSIPRAQDDRRRRRAGPARGSAG